MQVSFRDSLAFRSILYVTLLILIVGALALTVNSIYSARVAREESLRTIEALITTVEPHLEISTYLNDTVLAKSIAKGLSANEIVATVRIVANSTPSSKDEFTLVFLQAESGNENIFGQPIKRAIFSPFSEDESTGYIEIVRNSQGVKRLVDRAVINAGIPLLVLTLFIVISLLLLVTLAFKPFIARFIDQLNGISADNSELLECADRHKKDEVGALVHYINRMLGRLYRIRESERDLYHQNEIERKKIQAILEKAHTGIFLMQSDGRLQSTNPAFEAMFCSVMAVINKDSSLEGDFFPVLQAQDTNLVQQVKESVLNGVAVEHDLFVEDGCGNGRWLHLTLSPIEDTLFQGIVNDVTGHKEDAIAARTIAKTDALTGLYNRYAFDEHLEAESTAVAEKRSQGFALMFIDLDRFKPINDIHGHDAGDHVLGEVATRLKERFRSADFISRFGGDEFVVILHGFGSLGTLESIIQGMLELLKQPIILKQGVEVQIGASVGVAIMTPEMSIDSDTLLRNADAAMYRVKEQGRGSYCIHEDGFEKDVVFESAALIPADEKKQEAG